MEFARLELCQRVIIIAFIFFLYLLCRLCNQSTDNSTCVIAGPQRRGQGERQHHFCKHTDQCVYGVECNVYMYSEA